MRARSGTARALGVLALVVLTAAACGSSAPTTLGGAPGGYLITLGQLTSPDFTVYQAVKQVGSGWLDEASSTAVRKDGLVRAAAVEYDRNVSFSTSNGPITLTVAVASFATTGGATAAMIRLEAGKGAADRYTITVVTRIELKEARTKAMIYSNPAFPYTEDYEVPQGTDFDSVQTEAIKKIAVKFARQLVITILEGF